LNIGLNPTFEKKDKNVSVEVHLPDFEGELYGHDMAVFLIKRLRDEKAFPSPQALVEQVKKISKDVAAVTKNGLQPRSDFMKKWSAILEEAPSLG